MDRREGFVEIRKAADRFNTRVGWLDGRHSFSFGSHYDATNTHHGLLLVNNEDFIRPASGFSTHPHKDMEIVTWMLEGEVEHKDSEGNTGIIYPGLAQRMSAGAGIYHSEMNPSKGVEAHLVQMWVLPDTEAIKPSYEQFDINAELGKGALVPVASGNKDLAAIRIRQKDATLWAGRLAPGASVKVPEASHVHLFVAKGSGTLAGAGEFRQGDAARLVRAGSPAWTAGPKGSEVLIWQTQVDGP
ncbi:MAG: pirin family protein [Elusimicrobia bacterium]|nr:pirin family protein [Elusimicrobiota bacterium]